MDPQKNKTKQKEKKRKENKNQNTVISLNACILIVSGDMKFRIANKCLYSRKDT